MKYNYISNYDSFCKTIFKRIYHAVNPPPRAPFAGSGSFVIPSLTCKYGFELDEDEGIIILVVDVFCAGICVGVGNMDDGLFVLFWVELDFVPKDAEEVVPLNSNICWVSVVCWASFNSCNFVATLIPISLAFSSLAPDAFACSLALSYATW